LTILVDHRERAGSLIETLGRQGARVETAVLQVGDYVVGDRVGIERKAVADLHRSIRDRRLWTQVAALRADLRRAYLVVEGRSIDAGCISRAGIRASLLAVSELGVVVVLSADQVDSALWIWRIACRHGGTGARPATRSARRGRRPSIAVLSAVPGISPSLALALEAAFGSVAGVARASRQELMAIPGIGATRATSLQRALNGLPR
jgi:Fanconi anemia group M protein